MTNVAATSTGNKPAYHGIRWGWLLALGILMTVLGVIGLGMTFQLTLVAMFWLGAFAIVAGVAQVLDSFHHSGWKSIAWHVIIGILYFIAGILMMTTPVSAAFWLTLFLAISLVVTGLMRIFTAFQIRSHGGVWVAVLLSGIISIILGIMIYSTVIPPSAEVLATPEGQAEWLASWGWVIGLFVAIELIMEGLALIAISMGVKSAREAVGR